MLGHRGLAEGQLVDQVTHWTLVDAQQFEYSATVGLRKYLERECHQSKYFLTAI
jgi:hypothetical protein